MFAPGDDFSSAVAAIVYVRNCMSEEIKNLVTFHMVIPMEHIPTKVG